MVKSSASSRRTIRLASAKSIFRPRGAAVERGCANMSWKKGSSAYHTGFQYCAVDSMATRRTPSSRSQSTSSFNCQRPAPNFRDKYSVSFCYRVLNCGLKCAASSGSDSRMDVMRHAVSGGGKVYVKVDGPLTYPKWVQAYKAGRTFVSNSPMLFLDVEGEEPGAEIRLDR